MGEEVRVVGMVGMAEEIADTGDWMHIMDTQRGACESCGACTQHLFLHVFLTESPRRLWDRGASRGASPARRRAG